MILDVRMVLARRIAKEAGTILLGFFQSIETYELKGRANIVSEADKAAEAFLIQEIRHAFPADGILAEESGSQDWGTTGFVWVIDPLDGTTNFVHSNPHFAVSIGLLEHKNPVMGVVYAPVYNEIFYGHRGGGAYRNGERMSVSTVSTLASSLIASGFPYVREGVLEAILERVQRVLLVTHGFRRAGSAALDLCYVAAGRLDAYWEEGIQAWDIAAGVVLVEEAGGRCSGFDALQCNMFARQVVASNASIHDALLAVLFDRS